MPPNKKKQQEEADFLKTVAELQEKTLEVQSDYIFLDGTKLSYPLKCFNKARKMTRYGETTQYSYLDDNGEEHVHYSKSQTFENLWDIINESERDCYPQKEEGKWILKL